MLIAATRYDDCEAALRFLTEAFGFTEHGVYRDDQGRIVHAQLKFGESFFMFGPEDDGPFSAFMTSPAAAGGRETTTLYVIVPSVAEHFEQARAAGAEIVFELKDEEYGGQSYAARDLEGHVWTFGSYDPRG